MTDEQWSRAWGIFESACKLPPAKRREYILSASDLETAAEVLEMLDRFERSGSREESSACSSDAEVEEVPKPGEVIGRYRITGTLGGGGHGKVFAADDTELYRRVALKFVAPGRVGTSGAAEAFIREARAASALNHPNVVTVHEVIRAGPSLAIVMELVDGESLRSLCGTPRDIDLVASCGRQISEALAAAHARGILHRDVKPENVMLRRDGYVKVLDFGLAREVDESQSSIGGLPAGTLRYMSPEQASGQRATSASDIFALGIVLYELATGVHPFDDRPPLAVAHAIVTQTARTPSAWNSKLLPAFDALVLAMLEKDPERRPAAGEVARRLNEVCEPALRRSRRVVRAAAGLAAVALLGVSGWQWLSRRSVAPQAARPLIQPRALTDSSGNEGQPTFSPDGSEVAYAWDRGREGGNRCIWVRTWEGAGKAVTNCAGDEFDPAWSPDGSEIAFLRRSGPTIKVMIVPAGGGAERESGGISGVAAPNKRRLTWAPGGRELIVSDQRSGGGEGLSLYRLDLRTARKTVLTTPSPGTSDLAPAFSPDGRSLAFLRSSAAVSELYGADWPRISLHRIVSSGDPINSFAWLQDNRHLMFNSGRTIPDRLLRIAWSGGAPEPAPFESKGPAREMAVSRDGRRLAYVRPLTDSNIWSVSLANPPRTVRLTSSPQEDLDVRFSPDGARIVYASGDGGSLNLWLANPDGSAARQVTFLGGWVSSPAFSPSGQIIAFENRRLHDSVKPGNTTVWLLGVDGGHVRRLLDDTFDSYGPSWSRDGAWLYFGSTTRSGSSQIWKARFTGGGAPQQVTSNGGFEGYESADGEYLYFSKGPVGLWRLPLAGGPEEPVAEFAGVRRERYWQVLRDGIYFVDARGEPVLKFFEFATRRTRVLAHLPKPIDTEGRGFAAAPGGRLFLYSQYDVDRREILIATLP
jgi:eukaryotic-like serine/threonine-protein kinase